MSHLRAYPTLFLLLTYLGMASAQEAKEPEYAHFFGLNATGLLHTVLNTEEGENELPYLITYDWDLGKMHLRAAFGPEFESTSTTHEGFTDREETTYVCLDGRIGMGFDLLDNDRWFVIGGVDAIGRYISAIETLDTGFDAVSEEDETWSAGAGPFVQLAFRISPRVSISTEAGFYARYFENTITETFENFPDFNTELSKTTGWTLDSFLPSAIFIQFHF